MKPRVDDTPNAIGALQGQDIREEDSRWHNRCRRFYCIWCSVPRTESGGQPTVCGPGCMPIRLAYDALPQVGQVAGLRRKNLSCIKNLLPARLYGVLILTWRSRPPWPGLTCWIWDCGVCVGKGTYSEGDRLLLLQRVGLRNRRGIPVLRLPNSRRMRGLSNRHSPPQPHRALSHGHRF